MEKNKFAAQKAASWLASAALACVSLLCAAAGLYSAVLPDKFLTEINAAEYCAGDTGANQFPAFSTFLPVSAYGGDQPANATLKLFGVLPIKEVTMTGIERPVLTVCGTPFGLKIETDGVMVTGFGAADGSESGSSPAELAGIQAGDIIIKVNGKKIASSTEISDALNSDGLYSQNSSEVLSAAKTNAGNIKILAAVSGDPVKITVMRDGKKLEFDVIPEISETGYRLGIWTRDSCAGIGTLTFYDEEHNVFAGLGHSVCDIDTGVALPVAKGEIVPVSVSSVVKGVSGCPGELCGNFMSGSPSGKITGNLPEGVFGTALNMDSLTGDSLEMAFKQEVHPGEAKIVTTVNGMTPKEYSVYIEKVDYSGKGVKNLVVRITDPELLAVTGGIVQGMSGSPIIQNGRLAGAVTHVFVNDVTRGYGIFAENMYENIMTQ